MSHLGNCTILPNNANRVLILGNGQARRKLRSSSSSSAQGKRMAPFQPAPGRRRVPQICKKARFWGAWLSRDWAPAILTWFGELCQMTMRHAEHWLPVSGTRVAGSSMCYSAARGGSKRPGKSSSSGSHHHGHGQPHSVSCLI